MSDKQPIYKNIKELFGSDNYVIPIYQRNYEWEEPHITQLIQDILDSLQKNNEVPYYLGTLITYERKNEGNIIYETIDGQQRLTTLTILLCVIKNEYQYQDLSWYKKLNLSFDSRQIASKTLSALFNGENIDDIESNVAIKQAYNDAKKSLEKKLKENNLTINEFCEYFFKKVIILRVSVPDDTDLNHYFEIMNNRGEQLEKYEVLKAKMLEVLNDDNLRYAFNLIWEACSNMEKYVQYGFSVAQRNDLFGEKNWNNLVDIDTVYQKLQIPKDHQSSENELIALEDLLKESTEPNIDDNDSEENPDRFNTIINFSNFLLHVLRIQKKTDIPLDDKRLLETFDKILNSDKEDKREFVKTFGYNLLKSKFYFDKYIIKREFAKGTDQWSLKQLKWYDGNKVNYVNTFDNDQNERNDGLNREILMLLSMFHVSSPTLVYKHWLNAALKFVFEYSEKEEEFAESYKTYLENLAKAFLYDRFLAKETKDYFKIIYTNKGIKTNTEIDISKLNQGTAVENFVFNYLDYLLWQDYRDKKEYFKVDDKEAFEDKRILDFEFTFRSSVEHYYPQNPIDKSFALTDDDATWLDNFGNLCLISRSKNSRLSNFMPAAKKDYYTGSLTIDSIKQRIMMEYEQWDTNGSNNVNEIKDHYAKMVELLTKS